MRYGALLGIAAALILAGHQQIAGDLRLRDLAATGALLLFSLYANPGIVRFLARNRLSQFLGHISFLLYLWHFTVLVTLTSWLIVAAADADGTLPAPQAIGIGVLTVLTSVGIAYGTLPIEAWAQRVNVLLLRVLWREETAVKSASDA